MSSHTNDQEVPLYKPITIKRKNTNVEEHSAHAENAEHAENTLQKFIKYKIITNNSNITDNINEFIEEYVWYISFYMSTLVSKEANGQLIFANIPSDNFDEDTLKENMLTIYNDNDDTGENRHDRNLQRDFNNMIEAWISYTHNITWDSVFLHNVSCVTFHNRSSQNIIEIKNINKNITFREFVGAIFQMNPEGAQLFMSCYILEQFTNGENLYFEVNYDEYD